MIELKRLKLINWHNFENVTFDWALSHAASTTMA